MDGGAWWAAVHGVAKSRTLLRDFTFTLTHWRRKRQPTPVFLPGESQGWGTWWAAEYGVAQSQTRLKRLGAAAALAAAHTFIFGFLRRTLVSSTLFSSVIQRCPTLSDPMGCGNRGSLSIANSQTLINFMIRSWSSNLDPQTLLIFYAWKYVTFKKSLPICPTLQSWAIIFLVWVPSFFFFWNSL